MKNEKLEVVRTSIKNAISGVNEIYVNGLLAHLMTDFEEFELANTYDVYGNKYYLGKLDNTVVYVDVTQKFTHHIIFSENGIVLDLTDMIDFDVMI